METIVANHPRIHHRVTAGHGDIGGILEQFARLGVNTLAVNGGDGTVAHVFTALFTDRPFAQTPTIILLPGGTTNINAADAGLRGSLTDGVRQLCAWADGDHSGCERVQRALLRITGAVGETPLYGMFFGTGTIVNGIEYCHQNIHTLGIRDELAPGLVVLRTLWGIVRRDTRFAAPTPIGIALDERELGPDRPVIQLLITTLQRLFLGLRPFWGHEPQALRCTWMEHPAQRVLRAFPALLRGRPNRHVCADNGYFSHNAGTIRLWMDAMFTLDGEMHHASREQGPLIISDGGSIDCIRSKR